MCPIQLMLYLIGPDGLVNLSFENFQKMVWMTIVHVLRYSSHPWMDAFWGNLHTLNLQDMQIISDFITNRVINICRKMKEKILSGLNFCIQTE